MAWWSWPEEPASPLARVRAIGVIALALVGATIAATILESAVAVVDASPVYLVAVVLAAGFYGTWAAAGTSVAAFLVYDFLFTTPRFTFAVADPGEWLSLLLFLFVAVVIGRLAAMLRERAETADRRVREGVSLVSISRAIAMATSFDEAAEEVTERLRVDAEMASVRVSLTDNAGVEALVAQAGAPPVSVHGEPWTLLRDESNGSSDWVRIIAGTAPPDDASSATPSGRRSSEPDEPPRDEVYLVPIEVDGATAGAIHASRTAGDPRPGRGARRILSLAADQLAIALLRDELREELTSAEVARRSDALRGAILDSVSHDLRTPIATIRALAGGLVDQAVTPTEDERRKAAAAIDQEAERLAGLVHSLLDMSRIQAGALRPELEPYDAAELVETAVRRAEGSGGHRVVARIPGDLPPVTVDAALFDVAAVNVLDNALRYAPPPAQIRVTAAPSDDHLRVLLSIDDGGPGVPADAMPHLFDRFYRVPVSAELARHGLGMGLAIARGFLEAMGATIEADRSQLGGLVVRIGLPVAPPADPEPAGSP